MRSLRICLLSPWYGGSHKRWADGFKAASTHQVDILSMPDRHWKWRMHGAAVNLAQRVLSSDDTYDLFLADDMMDVAVFSSMIKGRGLGVPIVTYFHENQICYPVSELDTDRSSGRDLHYGYVNFTSCLASDRILFNSRFHQREFTTVLADFLSRFPDFNQLDLIPEIEEKSEVLPLGMNLKYLDVAKSMQSPEKQRPLILWNHRWEYDKCPEEFFRLLLDLESKGADFEVALLGERGDRKPDGYEEVLDKLGDRILFNGEVETYADYAGWLWRADIVPVTAIHDFFGTSVVESLYCKCHVFLPDRLVYPEHVETRENLYSDYEELLDKVYQHLQSGRWRAPPVVNSIVPHYDWESLIDNYDFVMSGVAGR